MPTYLTAATFRQRVKSQSTLSHQALHVALEIADHRAIKRAAPNEPLQLSIADLMRNCHMSRATFYRYLAECTAAGWIESRPIVRDGRQEFSEYLLAEGTSQSVKRRRPMTEAARADLKARSESRPVDDSESQRGDPESTSGETARAQIPGLRVGHFLSDAETPKYVVTSSAGAQPASEPRAVTSAEQVPEQEPERRAVTSAEQVPEPVPEPLARKPLDVRPFRRHPGRPRVLDTPSAARPTAAEVQQAAAIAAIDAGFDSWHAYLRSQAAGVHRGEELA